MVKAFEVQLPSRRLLIETTGPASVEAEAVVVMLVAGFSAGAGGSLVGGWSRSVAARLPVSCASLTIESLHGTPEDADDIAGVLTGFAVSDAVVVAHTRAATSAMWLAMLHPALVASVLLVEPMALVAQPRSLAQPVEVLRAGRAGEVDGSRAGVAVTLVPGVEGRSWMSTPGGIDAVAAAMLRGVRRRAAA